MLITIIYLYTNPRRKWNREKYNCMCIVFGLQWKSWQSWTQYQYCSGKFSYCQCMTHRHYLATLMESFFYLIDCSENRWKYINNRKPDAEAFIEAEIYESASRNRIISRAWKSSGSDKWTLDNKGTTKSSIQTVLNKLNIQVENLLQFLPQEKVSTFNSLR